MAAIETVCTVKNFQMITPTVFAVSFDLDKPVEFKGGQFVSIVIPGAGPNGRDLRRAYSIASAPESRPVELCIKLVEDGPGTQFLYKLRPGSAFRAYAPYGDFVYETGAEKHACFIATGTGIAPFRSMILSESFRKAPPKSALCLLGVRTEDELLYTDELSRLPGIKMINTVSQPTPQWDGFKGRVTDYVRSLDGTFPWLETEFYLCGNGSMITEIKSILAEKGVAKDSIHQEIYYK